MVKRFVIKVSVLSRKGRTLTHLNRHDDLSKEGVEKRDNFLTLSPGLLYSLINEKEAQEMGLVNQDQRLTRSW